jgi:hypothetical protein
MRPIAKRCQGGLAGRRCCLNMATIRLRRRLCWVAGGLLGRQHGSLKVSLPCGSARIGCKAVANPKFNTRPHSACGRRRGPPFLRPMPQAPYPSTTFCASPYRYFQNAKKARVWDRAF